MRAGNGRGRFISIAAGGAMALCVAGVVAAWLSGVWPGEPRDFEACEASVPATASPAERKETMRNCDVRFPARRKPGGGYVYFDMLQDRGFDIAGPAPTPAEQKRIDQAYVEYLGTQRRNEMAAEASRAQSDRLRQEFAERQAAASQPLVLNPSPPLPRPRPKQAAAPRQTEPVCTEGPLLCAWGKLQGALRPQPAKDAGSVRAAK